MARNFHLDFGLDHAPRDHTIQKRPASVWRAFRLWKPLSDRSLQGLFYCAQDEQPKRVEPSGMAGFAGYDSPSAPTRSDGRCVRLLPLRTKRRGFSFHWHPWTARRLIRRPCDEFTTQCGTTTAAYGRAAARTTSALVADKNAVVNTLFLKELF